MKKLVAMSDRNPLRRPKNVVMVVRRKVCDSTCRMGVLQVKKKEDAKHERLKYPNIVNKWSNQYRGGYNSDDSTITA